MVLWHVIFWAALTILLIVLEFASVQLIAVWFAAGGLLAFVLSFFGVPFYVQLIAFIAGSVLLLFLTRPLVKKLARGKQVHTNADQVIGKECVVREEIDNIRGTGRARVDGLDWSARSTDDTLVIPEGTICIIREIRGVKLIVSPAK